MWMDRSLKLQKCYEYESPTHCSNVDLYQKLKNIQIQICQRTSRLPSLQVGVTNSRKQLLSPFVSFTESVSNKGQTIAKRCESNALFTKVGQHSYQENAPISVVAARKRTEWQGRYTSVESQLAY